MAPYQSDAQRAYMHIHHPDIAARWDAEYPNQGPLPEHVVKKKRKKRDVGHATTNSHRRNPH